MTYVDPVNLCLSSLNGIIFSKFTILFLTIAFSNLNLCELYHSNGISYVLIYTQLQYIDMGKGVLTIQNSLKFFKIGIKSCRKHKNYVALDCGLGDRDPK